ncbi:fructosamine kinase family protein [Staphylococcus felis]|uniref:Fructosamine kinase family protein n=1 Tax=Staphylococcus felis TaxID=46127 RepID=A0A3E0IM62_9STAP|nr:fructosamine kinase family protein [Staphylococcus felis]REH83857.1 fructosamine kinase family protein [Staphylococcus felis]REH91275.1 fructosamine kinase family protein [Staphylococcus felis]REH91845.1 fructosamine kinase family protein [Staphylococcus felis]
MHEQWYQQLPLEGIQNVRPVSGGDVNEAYRIETTTDTYFLLVQPNRTEDFYDAEIAGLKAFEEAGITAPIVISSGEIEQDAYLLLSYLDEGSSGSQRELGALVAKLHYTYAPNGQYGFDLPYEGGDIRFENEWTSTWKDLFIHQRIDPLVERIRQAHLWTEQDDVLFESVRQIMMDTLGEHRSEPSLLHGDLWGGNYMFLKDGTPALFDPAPLYGDREFDLGATKVFGGFTQDFYDAYHQAYPLSEGAMFRIHFYELYLLLVHLVKFGTMYAGSVRRMMEVIQSEVA